ncbi:site-specific integrase [Hymenobacter sp. DG01]|uniref:site-specific integrase n=1 Tax=Hymenobacter sp. DG01 TaxID=2584940 RepID=UPI0021516B21|nr:site-specific integrase [Hymenobacter sp. DG01]
MLKDDDPPPVPFTFASTRMEHLPSITESTRAVGQARHLNDYAEKAGRYVAAGLEGAANTKEAYAGDWRRFTAWCTEYNCQPLPADVPTLVGFVTHLTELGRKTATIRRHIASIAKAHRLASQPVPSTDDQFKVFMEGVSRVEGVRQKQAPAFKLEHFKRAVQEIDTSRPAGLRDRALLLLGFSGAFRRDELASVNIEHLQQDEEGLLIDLPRSKTNQKGESEEKAVFYSPDRRTCPVRAVMEWVSYLQAQGRSTGPLFLSFRRGQHLSKRRLNTDAINLIVQQYLGKQYTSHSLRASFVTIAKLKGIDDSKIMNQTKHKTTAMIRRYTRLDSVRQHNAAQEIGL